LHILQKIALKNLFLYSQLHFYDKRDCMIRSIIMLLMIVTGLFADSAGSLVVSYQTDQKGERLERIRFRVTGEKGYSELYPKGGAVVNNTPSPCCLVAVGSLPPGNYTLEFIVPNQDARFEEVPPRKIEIEADKVTKVDQYIRPKTTPEEVIVAAPPVLVPPKRGVPLSKIDDERKIGTYEVTNKQFVRWLNRAALQKKIYIVEDPTRKGWILDGAGKVLFKTKEAAPTSQISFTGAQVFEVIPGKEHYPVIHVSWYGAAAFCRDFGYRLPTEAEWVHAAAQERDGSHRVFLYGFGRDQITPAWANYKSGTEPLETLAVLTTKVGFYNGKTRLPDGSPTMNAVSPYGAYDMSGNVWEWVADPVEGDRRLAKGGCYDSTAEGVRVTEKIALPPEHTDQFTGFRVYSAGNNNSR